MLWILDDYAGVNLHYDIDNFPQPRPLTPPDPARVKDYHRRKVDLAGLVIQVVVNPKATPQLIAEVADLVNGAGYTIPVENPDWLGMLRSCRFDSMTMASSGFDTIRSVNKAALWPEYGPYLLCGTVGPLCRIRSTIRRRGSACPGGKTSPHPV